MDAVVVSGPKGDQIFSLVGAESIYRLIVETMKEAAFTVAFDGTILFCNSQFGQFVQRPLEQIRRPPAARDFVARATVPPPTLWCSAREAAREAAVGPMEFPAPTVRSFRPHFGQCPESAGRTSICIVATDLTDLENSTELIQQLRRQQEASRLPHRGAEPHEGRRRDPPADGTGQRKPAPGDHRAQEGGGNATSRRNS